MEFWSDNEESFERGILKMITREELPEKIGMVGYPGVGFLYFMLRALSKN